MDLRGRRVLITGASGGIGGAIARELHRRGADTVLSARREESLRGLADELGATIVTADMTRGDSVQGLAEREADVDVLVLNAGVDTAEDLTEVSGEEIAGTISVNLIAPAQLAAAIGRRMRERGSGHIVFMSSMAGKMATAGNSGLYAATKWGLRGLALSLRDELGDSGVGVSCVFPGPVRGAGMFAGTGVELPRSVKTVSPEDVGSAVARAIEDSVGEIDVAPAFVRLGGLLGGLAPGFVAYLARRQGVDRVRHEMAAARRAR